MKDISRPHKANDVEVTPEMLAAGVRAYYGSSTNEEKMVYRIYRMMAFVGRKQKQLREVADSSG